MEGCRQNADDVEVGEVVGHVLAKSWGGPNHPINYKIISEDLNGEFTNNYDHLMSAFTASITRLEKILKKSQEIGNMSSEYNIYPGFAPGFKMFIGTEKEDVVRCIATALHKKGMLTFQLAKFHELRLQVFHPKYTKDGFDIRLLY